MADPSPKKGTRALRPSFALPPACSRPAFGLLEASRTWACLLLRPLLLFFQGTVGCGLKLKRRGKPPVLVHVSTYRSGKPFWNSGFLNSPQPLQGAPSLWGVGGPPKQPAPQISSTPMGLEVDTTRSLARAASPVEAPGVSTL